MIDKKLSTLITTYNTKTWEVSDNVFYLGRWCIPYEEEKNIKLDSIQNFHWEDKDKFQRDYKYLKIFLESVLKDLCNILNKFHNTDLNLRSWRIILGPWLVAALPIFWDRYENLRIFLKNRKKINTKIIKLNEIKLTSFNYKRFINIYPNSDIWNHYVYGDLIKKVFFEKSNIKYEEEEGIAYEERLEKKSLSLKGLIKTFFGNEFFIKNKKFLINDPYLSLEENVKLNYGLDQLPYWLTRFDENIFSMHKNNINLDLRKNLSLNIVSQNDYENYIKKNLISYIPMSYLENFKFYYNETEKIKFKGKSILSSGDYYSNDLFKIWLARQVIKKKSFYISSHGGGLPFQYDCFNHDESIADKKIVWHKPVKEKQIQLPFLKINDLNSKKNSKKILLLFYPWTSKYVLRAAATPQCTEVLEDFNQKIELINFLKPEISEFIKARIIQSQNWDLEKRFVDLVGRKYLDVERSYLSSLKNSKLVISGYPSTPFTESIALNKPTICVMIEKFWPIEEKFQNLKDDLYKNKIIFNNPIEAAEHIKSIYNNVDDWWQSKEVRESIKFFQENAIHIKNDKIKDWTNFLKNYEKNTG